MSDPFEEFDLDGHLAQLIADEPEPKPRFRFKFGGESYTLPPSIDLRAAASMQNGNLHDGLRALLGKEQWARLMESDATFDHNALVTLMEQYAKYTGAKLGESSGSTSSSKSTVGPSKRTSNGTTTPTLVR